MRKYVGSEITCFVQTRIFGIRDQLKSKENLKSGIQFWSKNSGSRVKILKIYTICYDPAIFCLPPSKCCCDNDNNTMWSKGWNKWF